MAVLGIVAVRGVRASRTGRVLLACATTSGPRTAYGISVVRAKLSAFALSGFLAGMAGCLYVQALFAYSEQPFEPAESASTSSPPRSWAGSGR